MGSAGIVDMAVGVASRIKLRGARRILVALATLVVQLGNSAMGQDSSDADRNWSVAPYESVLRTYVDDAGMVDYERLKLNRSGLDAFVDDLGNLSRHTFSAWSEADRIAFWINAYNALTLRAIIDHYPIKAGRIRGLAYPKNSIRQIPGVWTDLKWPVMGEAITLDEIEHKRLRENFDEPRIHAGLVCAALSCPPLRTEPYVGARLDEQLDDQMRRFLGDPGKFRIDRTENSVYLSSIFKWFGQDFVDRYDTESDRAARTPVERAVLNAVRRYMNEEDAAYLSSANYTVQYLDYDWSLNEQRSGQ